MINGIKNLGFFNFGVSFSVYYFLMFLSIPIFIEIITFLYDEGFKNYMDERYFLAPHIYTHQSLLFAFLGWIFFILAYFITPSVKRTASIFRADWSLSKTFYLSLILFCLGYIVKIPRVFTNSINYEMFSGTFLTPFSAFCISPGILHLVAILLGILGLYESERLQTSHHIFFKRLLIIIIPLFIISILLVGGGKLKLLAIALFFLIIHQMYHTIKIGKLILLLVFVTLFIFKIDLLKDELIQGSDTKDFSTNFDPYVERISQIQTFTQIILAEEKPVYGETFAQFLEQFKPPSIREDVINENEFGRQYQIIQNTDFKTGVAMTNIGDLYINFHLSGVLIGLLMLGILYKRLFTFLQNASIFGRFALPFLWVAIIHGIESSIGILLYNIISTLFILFIFHLLLIKSSPKVSI